jgi:maleamate amidohydrolase
MTLWDDLPFSEEDLAGYAKAGLGHRLGPGVAPALAIVDMNRLFTDSRFPLGSSEAAAPAVSAITGVLDLARRAGLPVVFTTTKSTSDLAMAGLWKGQLSEEERALLSSPEAHQIVGPIAPRQGELVIGKVRPSAFWQTGLADVLTYHRVDTLIVCGMVTSGCVRATVVDAFSHNLRVLVPAECVADRAVLPHKINLFDMHMKYADVVPTREVEEYLAAFV